MTAIADMMHHCKILASNNAAQLEGTAMQDPCTLPMLSNSCMLTAVSPTKMQRKLLQLLHAPNAVATLACSHLMSPTKMQRQKGKTNTLHKYNSGNNVQV